MPGLPEPAAILGPRGPLETAAASPLVPTTLTTLAMNAKLKVAALIVVVCGSGLWLASRERDVTCLISTLG